MYMGFLDWSLMVKTAKPTLNTTPPKTYCHLTVKMKNRKVAVLNCTHIMPIRWQQMFQC